MSSPNKILIRRIRIFDPAQSWRGEERDLYLAQDRVSAPFSDPELVIDGEGRLALAGGIDPHCHLALPGESFLRLAEGLPSLEILGETYARLGYVHVHEPFTTLLTSRASCRLLERIPFVDKSFRVVLDLRDMGRAIKGNNYPEFCAEARAALALSGALGLFLPFPFLRHKERHYIQKNISSKKIMEFLSAVPDEGLFPIAIWGQPGLFDNEITSASRFHIAGLSGALNSEAAREKAAAFLEQGGSADLGLSLGEKTLAVSSGEEMRSECVPDYLSLDIGINYPLRINMEYFLLEGETSRAGWKLMNDLKENHRLALSLSGPAGGPAAFLPGPAVWLLNRAARPNTVKKDFPEREFDWYELARLTRWAPAQALGLKDLGHLKVGARAQVAVYDLQAGVKEESKLSAALKNSWLLIKDGAIVRQNGDFTGIKPPAAIRRRNWDADLQAARHSDLLQHPTLRWEHLKSV